MKAVLERRMAAFRAINTLRKLCNHPELVHILYHNTTDRLYYYILLFCFARFSAMVKYCGMEMRIT